MSQARIYFVKLNLDDFAATVAGLDSDLEYRQFIDGFLVGARGFEARDTWSEAKINGHAIGDGCFKDAQRFSASQREKVMHRYQGESTELPRNYHGSTGELPENYLTNNQQLVANSNKNEAPSPWAPLVPVVVKPGRREKKKQKLGTFPEEVVQMVSRLIDLWPTERGGQTFRSDDVKACGNVVLILEEFGDVTVTKLEAAAMGYLSTKPPYPNALEFWFGKSKTAPWRAEVMLVNREEVRVI